jgi:uncharacterized protein (DUF2147 family)
MKTVLLAAAAALAFAGQALAADPAGLWATPTNGGQVEISHCGNSLCGKLVTSKHIAADPAVKDAKNRDVGLRDRPLKGLQMLYDFTGGPTKWAGGKVYNPDDGGTYSGTIEMTTADSLKLKGCIVAPFCKTQVWNRVR